jgi:hypothetical protein
MFCVLTYFINAKLKTGKRVQTIELTGRSPLRRRMPKRDCSAIQEEEEEEEGEPSINSCNLTELKPRKLIETILSQ